MVVTLRHDESRVSSIRVTDVSRNDRFWITCALTPPAQIRRRFVHFFWDAGHPGFGTGF
jgi:hypothetical protein